MTDNIEIKYNNPESKFKQKFKKYLESQGWIVEYLPSSMYSKGWPDLLCMHPDYKCHKWVEAKDFKRKLRETQTRLFTKMAKCNIPVYVIEGDDKVSDEYLRRCLLGLFNPPNWHNYIS